MIIKEGLTVDTAQRLAQMKLFNVMSEEDLSRWVSKFRREQYPRGAVIIRENDRATAFYIVDQGELRARARDGDRELPRAYFYPGDYFGETGLLTGELRNATIDVLTDAELLVLDKMDFDQMIE
jgi:CRP-like cAMP-binding protein